MLQKDARMISQYHSLKNKHILVTGGGNGIGKALVQAFHQQGAMISFLDIDEENSLALQQTLQNNITYYKCNICDIDSLQQAIARAEKKDGPIACLLNNAARDTRYEMSEITEEIWDNMHQVNMRHVFFASQAVHKGMAAIGGGSIINFTSTSYVKRSPKLTAYGSSKAGIIGLTRTLSRDLGKDNIRVNAIMPGWIMTERQKELWLTPEMENEIMQTQSLKHFIQPEDVAKLALFLASDDSKMISAQNYIIDGGWV